MTLPLSARALASVAAVVVVAGCGGMRASTRPATAPTRAFIDRMSFGRDIPTGGTVTDSAWQVFLDQVVIPRFPNGFGVMRGEGVWRYEDGRTQREESFHLELYSEPGKTPADSTLEAIAREYIKRFNQEAVSRSRIPVMQWMYWSEKRR